MEGAWFEYYQYSGFRTNHCLHLDISNSLDISLNYEKDSKHTSITFSSRDLILLLCYIRDYDKNVKTSNFTFFLSEKDKYIALQLIRRLIIKYGYENE